MLGRVELFYMCSSLATLLGMSPPHIALNIKSTEQAPKLSSSTILGPDWTLMFYVLPDSETVLIGALIFGLMNVDVKKRMTLEEAMNHPWVRRYLSPSNILIRDPIEC
jgi:serine/threonine protein kinase